MSFPDFSLDRILQKAKHGETPSAPELQFLLGLSKPAQLDRVFEAARFLRNRHFGNKVFLYSFIYFSTYCRNDCSFCYYRRANPHPGRYRKTETEILESAHSAARSGVHLVDLTMGEDPFYYQKNGFGTLVDLVGKVKEAVKRPVMISPGVVPGHLFSEFARAGADWYACYQETHNKKLFERLRPGQDYDLRYSSKKKAMQSGLLVEDGILAGVGETRSDIAASLRAMRSLGAHQARVMSFVPQKGTPMSSRPSPSRTRELLAIALLRLLMPHRLIPASLDVDGAAGLRPRLDAGANVITSLITPQHGYAGVAQSTKDINEGYRTVGGIAPALKEMGFEIAPLQDYEFWIGKEKEKQRRHFKEMSLS